MDCREVRDLLAEHALGTVDLERRGFLERHLEWCAGCRKELAELAEGAVALARLSPPAEPPAHLEQRVVDRIATRVARRPRRPRASALAAVLAAFLALGALGWAVALNGKVARLEEAAHSATSRAERFDALLREILRSADGGRILSAQLAPIGDAAGGGRAVVFDSPGGYDYALVIVGGLPEAGGPYRAALSRAGERERIGLLSPSADGEMAAYRIFEGDISEARWILVTDGTGATVLRGPVAPEGS